jgi:SAM-dependent methyltransferase
VRSSTAPDSPQAAAALELPPRGRFEGVLNVVRFNWPLYVVGLLAVTGTVALARWAPLPVWAARLMWVGGAAAFYLLVASLVASFWIYDRSPLYRFEWAKQLAGPAPRRILNLHSGFDESSIALRQAFPDATLDVLDFYDARRMTEPSIARARRYQARTAPAWLTSQTRPARPTALPLEDASADVAFVILSAHEIRDPADRRAFFAELARALPPGGRVILVEHLRDPANFLVFGPQFVHFYSARTWLDLARGAGLNVLHRSRITPFIGVFVFQKPGAP